MTLREAGAGGVKHGAFSPRAPPPPLTAPRPLCSRDVASPHAARRRFAKETPRGVAPLPAGQTPRQPRGGRLLVTRFRARLGPCLDFSGGFRSHHPLQSAPRSNALTHAQSLSHMRTRGSRASNTLALTRTEMHPQFPSAKIPQNECVPLRCAGCAPPTSPQDYPELTHSPPHPHACTHRITQS